ncbi:NAD-dependent epimerase/dehydratase family protein [Agromyces badenianii]|uniref:polysaccharide biosynthesis C-terminal domain-containing protein n=1 Tax=Agromyces badenianii TaxID=2080742 RepID=UPI000D58F577|nr:NAD-dependent epimerase/dehydratase family protein [Agromyces badenianii]PWC04449.1 capsular biosynthesis protein [Agromyces badenianii]
MTTDQQEVSRVALTGARGFLGWHTRAALLASGGSSNGFPVGDGFQVERAVDAIEGVDRLIHLAGVNRGTDEEVFDGNIRMAEQTAAVIRSAADPPAVVVFANSIQSGNTTPYGRSKARARDILAEAASDRGLSFSDIALPNVFGEHGRPFYNSVVATFCHVLADGGVPSIEHDKPLTLLHAQDAADVLLGRRDLFPVDEDVSVGSLLSRLRGIAERYRSGDIPDVAGAFERDLFNTYRAAAFERAPVIPLERRSDRRGAFFEIVRSHGGSGQSSFSTTVPGVSRGDHFHRRKIERFTVLSGTAVIALRRVLTDEVLEFRVSGAQPVAIDMPTLWSHKITNTGDDDLFTSFWSNEIFDPETPDTIAEAVAR